MFVFLYSPLCCMLYSRALHGPEFRGPAREGHGPARFFFYTSQPGPWPARPGPARLCFPHCGPDRPGPSIYVMRNIAISIVKQLATAKSCFSCIQDILLMSERCQTVSSSGPYLVQVVSDFRSNEQPGPARGRSRPGPFSTHYFQARPVQGSSARYNFPSV